MKKLIPAAALAFALFIVFGALVPRNHEGRLDVRGFAGLPVQEGGRFMPLDSLARNNLRLISGRTTVDIPEESGGGKLGAASWLMETAMRPENADRLPVFRVDNSEVKALLGQENSERKYFAFTEIVPHSQQIFEARQRVNENVRQRSAFENQVVKLYEGLVVYHQTVGLLAPPGSQEVYRIELDRWEAAIPPGREALAAREAGEAYDQQALERFLVLFDRYRQASGNVTASVIPPGRSALSEDENDWLTVPEALMEAAATGEADPALRAYAELMGAYRSEDIAGFNAVLDRLHGIVDGPAPLHRVQFESFFNSFAPFYQAAILYVLVFLLAVFSWLFAGEPLRRAAVWVLVLTFLIHTFGLLARMYIQGTPPVTNLYSTAVFVGWGVVIFGFILERITRNGLGSALSAAVGFATLIVAYNLAKTGDTLEPMRAVLASNFWLGTHVVIITFGYSAMFVAGCLGIVYILWGTLTRTLDRTTGRTLMRATYGIICFATLLSFVGTMLGGVWADQSWGRFWGWDPKENGALLIVLWCAIMLHARWGKITGDRGFANMAIFGNVITAWSWFGTNQLGVGLHSYGFTDSGAFWLSVFWASQLAIMAVGALPLRYWNSARALGVPQPSPVAGVEPPSAAGASVSGSK